MDARDLKLWYESEKSIDSRIALFLSQREWDSLLPNGLDNQDRMKAFYSHIMYVINSFLEEENTRELFIQIPVEEFANKDRNGRDDKQIKRFRWLNGTIAACLQMATIEQSRKNVFIPNDVDYENTRKWYKEGDCFFIGEIERKNQKEKGFCDYKKKRDSYGVKGLTEEDLKKLFPEDNEENRKIKLEKLCLRFYSSTGPDFTNPKLTFSSCNKNTITRIKQIPSQKKDGAIKIQNELTKLERVSALTIQHKSAAVVSIGKYKPLNEALVDNLYLDIPIMYISDYHNLTNEDIIVVCGDSKYKGCAQSYRNSKARKIVYIGSEPPFDGNLTTYPFTFRELYRYCSSSNVYTEPSLVTLQFQWLNERIEELRTLLHDCCQIDEYFTEEDAARIERGFSYRFSRYDFDSAQLNRIQEELDEDYLKNNFNLSIDISDRTVENIIDWVQALEYDDDNPKKKWIIEFKKKYMDAIILGKSESYRKKIKNICGFNNIVIMDNLTVTPKDRRYPDILRYHMFTNITVLYYTNEEYARKQLINYINKEFEYYRDELRVSLKTDLELEPQIIEVLPSWIDGFFDDEYKFNESISAQSQKCKVTFNDGTYDNIDGDVIVDLGEEGYEVMNIRDCEKDMVISYYSGITNIDDMILHYAKYANQWELVIKYSNLWKQKFMDVYQSLIADGLSKSEAIRDISNSCGLKRDRVKAYCEENNHRFLRSKKEMRAVLNFLASRELLTDDDKRNTIHAMYYSNNIPLTFGTALKKELYDYFMNEKASTPILDELCQNNTFKKEEIFSSTIVQNKTIKTIKIIKNNE